jgi:hypothetical protein
MDFRVRDINAKVKLEMNPDDEIDLVTVITVNTKSLSPKQLAEILSLAKSGHQLCCKIYSPQLSMGNLMDEVASHVNAGELDGDGLTSRAEVRHGR